MPFFLVFLYTNQSVNVKWDNQRTTSFSVSNGVKQGGVLSPILFAVYLDELLLRLKATGLGCHIGHVYLGSVAYADDVIILAPTKLALDKMLTVAKNFSNEFDINFNPNKSKLVVFHPNGHVTVTTVP